MENKEPVENKESKEPEKNKMEIEINKYKNLVDALGDPVRVARMVLLIAAVTVIVAIGIIAIVCGIKRFYPYKSINSNPYGATIIQDEDNEIIYWLFNTADLWANSGIKVEEGDIISVRTSGAFHTAIHHLVEDANDNTILRDPWILSSGRGPLEGSPLYNRSKERTKYRIAPGLPQNTILMQVIPPNVGKNNGDTDWRTDTSNACFVDGKDYISYKVTDHCKSGLKTEKVKPDIYEIGLGKENIRIRKKGILHFAVNDIALTHRVIDSMKSDPDSNAMDFHHVHSVWLAKTTDKFNALFSEDGLRLIRLTNKKKGNALRIDTISSEEWNLQHFKQLGLIDKNNQPIKKYWNIEALNDSSLLNLFESLKNPTFLKKMYADNTIWREIEHYKCVKLVKRETISTKDSSKVMKYGYKIDSIWDDKYQKQMGFHNKVRIFDNIWEDAYTRDSISLPDSTIIRCSFKKDDLDCLCSGLFFTRIGLLEQVLLPKELDYYRHHNFVDAWFVDNIGSFMIVIERKKVK